MALRACGLRYATEDRERDFIQRLLDLYLNPGGRLLLCSYGSSRRPAPLVQPIDEQVAAWGFNVGGFVEAIDPANGIPVTRVAWIDVT